MEDIAKNVLEIPGAAVTGVEERLGARERQRS